jgi:conjugative relaxase-like TrwC/TraI family protein
MAVRLHMSESADAAKKYFTQGLEWSDYWAQDGYTPGVWFGKGAEILGLSGEVDREHFYALLAGRNPFTGEKLTARIKDDRRCGYDMVFSPVKSFSSLWARAREYPELQERLIEVFRDSVLETLREDVEPMMQTRLRRGGQRGNIIVGNVLGSLFLHHEARPMADGSDPHLHYHAYLQNLVWAPHENRWQAGEFHDLHVDREAIEAAFEARLALRVKALKAEIAQQVKLEGRRERRAWEIGGVPASLIAKDSRRTQEIEDVARRRGITDDDEKGKLGAQTRRGKVEGKRLSEQFDYWESRQTPEERDALAGVLARMAAATAESDSVRVCPNDPALARLAVDWARRHLFEKDAVVRQGQLASAALRYGVGGVSPEGIREAIEESIGDGRLLAGIKEGRRLLTTKEAFDREQWVIGFARRGRGTCRALAEKDRPIRTDWLNRQQRRAIRWLWDSHDRVILLRGAPGVGKTTLLQEAVEGIEANGKQVFALAPSADASRGTLRESGFAGAETVAMLLKDERFQRRVAGQVLLVDEGSLLGAKDGYEFFRLAERLNCRVIVAGDVRQHSAVEHPGLLCLLENEAGLPVAEVDEIQRQRGKYKRLVELLVAGDTDRAIDRMAALGWLREIKDPEERERQLVTDYLGVVHQPKGKAGRKTALVVSPTHAEGERVTAAIRSALRQKGKIEGEEHELQRLVKVELSEAEKGDALRYVHAAGEVVQFYQNAKGGFKRGQRVTVVGRDDLGHVCVRTDAGEVKPLRLDEAAKFEVFRPRTLRLAAGDRLRITGNGHDLSGMHALNNGAIYTVAGFTPGVGDLVLSNGWLVSKDYGHFNQGYVVTSQGSQSKTVDQVVGAVSSESFPALSREAMLVMVSRGRDRASFVTDSLDGLKDAVRKSERRLTATELLKKEQPRHQAMTQQMLRYWAMREEEERRWAKAPVAAVASQQQGQARPAAGWAKPELRTTTPVPRPRDPSPRRDDHDPPSPQHTR